jgi:predicted membrane protein
MADSMADKPADSKKVIVEIQVGKDAGTGGCMTTGSGRQFPIGLYLGIAILLFGVILLLDQVGIVSADYIFSYFWPAVFIFFGVGMMARRHGFGRFWGMALLLTGALFLLSNFHMIHVTAAVIWPVLIIFWGVWLVLQAVGRGPQWKAQWVNEWKERIQASIEDDSGEFHPESVAIFSAVKRRITTKDFKGGKLTAVFGGFDIDLTEAEMQGDEAHLEANAVFGGGEIYVPTNWLVTVNGAAIFGEYSDKTRRRPMESSGTKRLIIKGAAVFGAVIIKN